MNTREGVMVDPWIGKRILTLIADMNELEGRGEVVIPIGWTGKVDRLVHYDDGEAMYAVLWDDDPGLPGVAEGNMGWTIWSASELRDSAEAAG